MGVNGSPNNHQNFILFIILQLTNLYNRKIIDLLIENLHFGIFDIVILPQK